LILGIRSKPILLPAKTKQSNNKYMYVIVQYEFMIYRIMHIMYVEVRCIEPFYSGNYSFWKSYIYLLAQSMSFMAFCFISNIWSCINNKKPINICQQQQYQQQHQHQHPLIYNVPCVLLMFLSTNHINKNSHI
jgi:hypothetical protein